MAFGPVEKAGRPAKPVVREIASGVAKTAGLACR